MKLFAASLLALLGLALVALEPRSTDAAAIICDDESSPSSPPPAAGEISPSTHAPTAADRSADQSDESAPSSKPPPPPSSGTEGSSDVKQFFTTVQCTLEKARPLVEQIEKEAKRLGQTAQRLGLDVLHRFTVLFDKLLSGPTDEAASGGPSIVDVIAAVAVDGGGAAEGGEKVDIAATSAAPPLVPTEGVGVGAGDGNGDEAMDNEILDAAVGGRKEQCPNGFEIDVRGLCQRSVGY